jgi:Uncharacterised protein conserved in bacteria (DUF2336)
MVCEPVILFSPMLTQEDLVALIASGPPSSTILAVASRPRIGPAVSDAIVEVADPEAIRALLCNQTAQIREATLDALVAQSEHHTGWQEPLVRRPQLSPRAQRMLAEIALRTNEMISAKAMLAVKAGVALPVVERAYDLRSAKAIVSLAWKAGLSPQTAVILQTMLGYLPAAQTLRPGKVDGFPLSEDEMRWQLTFLGAPEIETRTWMPRQL